jgi:DNA-binding response OmpR family regulator
VADRYDAARVPCAEYLDHFGFEVRQASDTQAALQSIRTTPPHLMLLELSLPGEAGLSLGEWLAKDAQARHIPVIVMSSAFQSNGASHPMPDHTAGVLVKPFPLATMLEEVRRALRSQAAPIAS